MSRNYRRIILAVVGLVALSAAKSTKPNIQPPSEAASNQVARASPATSVEQPQVSADLNKPCGKGADNRSSDLCAQWKAADAARSASIATWIFGAIGSLVGIFTLAAAWRAAKWAKKAAEHTEAGATESRRSNEIAQLIGKVEVGANVFIPTLTLSLHDDATAQLTMIVENDGRSKATKISIECVTNFYAIAGNITKFSFAERGISVLEGGAKKPLLWKYKLSDDQFLRFKREGVTEVISFGFFSYRDIFDERVELDFCFRSVGAGTVATDGRPTALTSVPLAEVYGRNPDVQSQIDDYREVPYPGTTMRN